jgi:hypothetical protein
MPVTAAPSLPRYSLFFDVVGSDGGEEGSLVAMEIADERRRSFELHDFDVRAE